MRIKLECISVFWAITSVFCLSCGDEKTGSELVMNSSDITLGDVTPTAFSATISGTFKDITTVDIALGKNGIMYCPESVEAETVFKSWLDGNDQPDCQILIFKEGFKGESFTGVIKGLSPETEYSFCLFSQGMDASKRKISPMSTFTTSVFNPVFNNLKIEDIHYIDVTVSGSIVIDANDASYCRAGIVVSETQGGDLDSALSIAQIKDMSCFSITMNGLKPDKTYYCKAYVKYAGSDGEPILIYSQDKEFSTLTSDKMYVDLGLTSGIKWANCTLGEWEFNVDICKDDLYFRWGSFKLAMHDSFENDERSKYDYLEQATGSYTDIGTDISGTKYDVAHALLGGKWRLPRKEEVEELMDNCDMKMTTLMSCKYWYPSSNNYYQDEAYAVKIVGPNGNYIELEDEMFFWTGTLSEDYGQAYSFIYYTRKYASSGPIQKVDYRKMDIWSRWRELSARIRPVWDSNMPE